VRIGQGRRLRRIHPRRGVDRALRRVHGNTTSTRRCRRFPWASAPRVTVVSAVFEGNVMKWSGSYNGRGSHSNRRRKREDPLSKKKRTAFSMRATLTPVLSLVRRHVDADPRTEPSRIRSSRVGPNNRARGQHGWPLHPPRPGEALTFERQRFGGSGQQHHELRVDVRATATNGTGPTAIARLLGTGKRTPLR